MTDFNIRTLNRYTLHPKNQRMCFKCKHIYTDIQKHFNIKKYYENNSIGWDSRCKLCQSQYNLSRRLLYRQDPLLFITHCMPGYKQRAKEMNLPIDIDPEYLANLFENQEHKCYYTKELISFESVTEKRNCPHPLSPSIDRLNPKLGYTKGNVVWCAYYVNRMKNDLCYNDFIKTCQIIIHNQEQKII